LRYRRHHDRILRRALLAGALDVPARIEMVRNPEGLRGSTGHDVVVIFAAEIQKPS
jgi:hypothetical protein